MRLQRRDNNGDLVQVMRPELKDHRECHDMLLGFTLSTSVVCVNVVCLQVPIEAVKFNGIRKSKCYSDARRIPFLRARISPG